jgi:hypothetical protein
MGYEGGIPLIEPVPIQDVFATGRSVQWAQDFVRIIYWSEQPLCIGGPEPLAPIERQVCGKIIMPRTIFMANRMRLRLANAP